MKRLKDTPCRYIYRDMPCTAIMGLVMIKYARRRYPEIRRELEAERDFFAHELQKQNSLQQVRSSPSCR